MEEKIKTLHPEGKQGVNISAEKYNQVKTKLIDIIQREGQISYQSLNKVAKKELSGTFQGSIPWYVVTVKLDLEARGIIERLPGKGPHILKIANSEKYNDFKNDDS